MSPTRRTTLRGIAAAGALTGLSGTVYAVGEHDDDDRDPTPKEEKHDDKEEPEEPPEEEPAPPTTGVRAAHLSPDAPNVDIYVDGDQVLADVPYGAISPYLEVPPGSYRIEITAAGDREAVVFDQEVAVEDGFYTLAAIGELEADTFDVLVLTDAGSALVRVVHASPDAPAVDVSTAGDTLLGNLEFGQASNYLAVAAGDYTLDISPAGDPESVVASVDVSLAAGTAYSAFAAGYLEPPEDAEDRAFEVILTADGPGANGE